MISAYNYFRKLSELKERGIHQTPIMEDLQEIFHELPEEMKAVLNRVVNDNRVDAKEVTLLKRQIYRNGEPGGYDIRLLFEIHDHVLRHQNDSSWEKLFMEETLKYFSSDFREKKKIPIVKAALLMFQIKNSIAKNGIISDVETRLVKELIKLTGTHTFSKSSDLRFLSELYENILRDSRIDLHEVELLREMILQHQPPLREDLELMMEINHGLKRKPKHEKWQELFLESLWMYLLTDPDKIDYEKIPWFENRLTRSIEVDGELTTEERILLLRLRQEVTNFPPSLERYLFQTSS